MERFDLGRYRMPITTPSADAHRLYNLGLNWCYGFNQEEGVACFRKALEHDPECAMGYWGLAYAAGPFYNFTWRDMSEPEARVVTAVCYRASRDAQRYCHPCTDVEQALIEALTHRFQAPQPVSQSSFDTWDTAYASAMRKVYMKFPENQDVMALFIEALITRTPWQLWNVKTGQAADGADTLEALAVCERAIALADQYDRPQHPAILHLHIHLTEMSNEPQRAMRSADLLGELCPDAGHLNHMPGHTYVLCGEYQKAMQASEKAVAADELYLDYAGPHNFYTTARCHDLHLQMYTGMLMGQMQPAVQAAEKICATLTEDVLTIPDKPFLAMTLEGYFAMKMHVLVRFGQWQQIIDAAMPPCATLYCVSTSMHHYARAIAFATLKQFKEAEQEQTFFHQSLTRIPDNRRFFNNPARDTLGIAEKMIEGELLYHQAHYRQAFEALRESVVRDDRLAYSEPWAWMHPPRHALGALLLEQGHYTEAELVYRTDLGLNGQLQRCAQHPDNVWALHGLVECLRHRNAVEELACYQPRLARAAELTDVPVNASCQCRGTV